MHKSSFVWIQQGQVLSYVCIFYMFNSLFSFFFFFYIPQSQTIRFKRAVKFHDGFCFKCNLGHLHSSQRMICMWDMLEIPSFELFRFERVEGGRVETFPTPRCLAFLQNVWDALLMRLAYAAGHSSAFGIFVIFLGLALLFWEDILGVFVGVFNRLPTYFPLLNPKRVNF